VPILLFIYSYRNNNSNILEQRTTQYSSTRRHSTI